MKSIFILFILLSSCGMAHQECEITANNTCFHVSDSGVTEGLLRQTMAYVEINWNDIKDIQVDLSQLAKVNDLYVEFEHISWRERTDEEMAGYYQIGFNDIKVYYHTYLADTDEQQQTDLVCSCFEKYRTFGHELLHFITDNELGKTGHYVPSVFTEWAEKTNDWDNNVEARINIEVDAMCEAIYGHVSVCMSVID